MHYLFLYKGSAGLHQKEKGFGSKIRGAVGKYRAHPVD